MNPLSYGGSPKSRETCRINKNRTYSCATKRFLNLKCWFYSKLRSVKSTSCRTYFCPRVNFHFEIEIHVSLKRSSQTFEEIKAKMSSKGFNGKRESRNLSILYLFLSLFYLSMFMSPPERRKKTRPMEKFYLSRCVTSVLKQTRDVKSLTYSRPINFRLTIENMKL